MKRSVITETAMRIVCNGYTTEHMIEPKGNPPKRRSVKSKVILTAHVAKSVRAKFRMRYSVTLK